MAVKKAFTWCQNAISTMLQRRFEEVNSAFRERQNGVFRGRILILCMFIFSFFTNIHSLRYCGTDTSEDLCMFFRLFNIFCRKSVIVVVEALHTDFRPITYRLTRRYIPTNDLFPRWEWYVSSGLSPKGSKVYSSVQACAICNNETGLFVVIRTSAHNDNIVTIGERSHLAWEVVGTDAIG